jgi:hypothetical protein
MSFKDNRNCLQCTYSRIADKKGLICVVNSEAKEAKIVCEFYKKG